MPKILMTTPINKQPVNNLAPWGVSTDDGEYVGVQTGGLYATRATVDTLVFGDGSIMQSAGVGLPNPIDAGTF